MSQRNTQLSNSSFQDSADSPMMDAPDSPPADANTGDDQPATATTSAAFSASSAQSATSNTGNKSISGAMGKSKVDFGTPGSAWSGKKHLDEYTRAMNGLVDRDSDANTRFGDVLQSKTKH